MKNISFLAVLLLLFLSIYATAQSKPRTDWRESATEEARPRIVDRNNWKKILTEEAGWELDGKSALPESFSAPVPDSIPETYDIDMNVSEDLGNLPENVSSARGAITAPQADWGLQEGLISDSFGDEYRFAEEYIPATPPEARVIFTEEDCRQRYGCDCQPDPYDAMSYVPIPPRNECSSGLQTFAGQTHQIMDTAYVIQLAVCGENSQWSRTGYPAGYHLVLDHSQIRGDIDSREYDIVMRHFDTIEALWAEMERLKNFWFCDVKTYQVSYPHPLYGDAGVQTFQEIKTTW